MKSKVKFTKLNNRRVLGTHDSTFMNIQRLLEIISFVLVLNNLLFLSEKYKKKSLAPN